MPALAQMTQIEVEQLQMRLTELEQTLEAIRSGEVDALVVDGSEGPRIYTLQTSDQPYREFVEQMSEGAASVSETGIVLFCNERLAEMVGQPPAKIIGAPVGALIAGPDRAAFKELLDRSLEGEAKSEIHLQRSDGKAISVEASLRGLVTERGQTIFMVATDLTKQREAEQAIRMHANRHDALVSTTSDGYWRCDTAGKLLEVNDSYCDMSGYSRELLLKMYMSDLEASRTPQSMRELIRRLIKERFVRFETQHCRSDGALLDVEISASYLAAAGELLVFVRNITRRKEAEKERHTAEEKLRRINEELESRVAARTGELQALNKELESFSYAVAHDLRAPLRQINGYAGLLTEALRPNLTEAAKSHLTNIQQGAQRMGHLLEDMLSLARLGQQKVQTQTCGLGRLVEEVVRELEPEVRDRHIEWRIEKLPFVDCDPGLMKQVVWNLLSNAVKFSKFRPVAVIEIGSQMTEKEAVIFVTDNGAGFDMQYAGKLFGIFQRLHRQEDFEGTGVGLAIVQRIIQKHGGRVWADAELNKGATFYFSLPASRATSQ